jgi:hypothetical protein|tara:strand:- start:448 stop:801 length:354 start_codon:yes stop_codon:yes gene_type:complete
MNSANVELALERWATKYNEKWEANIIYFGKLARKQEEEEQRAKEAKQRRKAWVILRRANPKSAHEETMTDLELSDQGHAEELWSSIAKSVSSAYKDYPINTLTHKKTSPKRKRGVKG